MLRIADPVKISERLTVNKTGLKTKRNRTRKSVGTGFLVLVRLIFVTIL